MYHLYMSLSKPNSELHFVNLVVMLYLRMRCIRCEVLDVYNTLRYVCIASMGDSAFEGTPQSAYVCTHLDVILGIHICMRTYICI